MENFFPEIFLDEPLSEEMVKSFHKNLKEGIFEDLANGYAVGDWKKRANIVGTVTTALPQVYFTNIILMQRKRKRNLG